MASTERDLFTTQVTPASQPVSLASSPTTQQTLGAPAPAAPSPSTPATPASQTNVTPPSQVPTAPVVAAPVLSQVKDNETVSGQLREILGADSPILQSARKRAQVYSASRGLQNSTLAGQAGEQAVIDAAVPIAATDAQTYSQRAIGNQQAQNVFGSQQQQFEQQQQLSSQDHYQRLIEQAQAGDINSRLQLEQAGYNKDLSAQENIQRLQQLAAEGDIQAKLSLQQFNQQTMLAAQQQGYAIELSDKSFQQNQQMLIDEYTQRLGLSAAESRQEIERLNAQHQNTLEEISAQSEANAGADSAKWTRDLQAAYLNAVTTRQMAASQEIQSIYTTQGLTSAQQQAAVQNARARLQTDIDALGAYYRQSPGWPTTGSPTPGAPGGAPAPGASPTPGVPREPTTEVPIPPGPGETPGSRPGLPRTTRPS